MPINPELVDNSQDDTGTQTQKNQISSGQSAGVSPGSSVASQAGGASKQSAPTSSGSFTNLNQYVDANKDQAAGLGGHLAGEVQGQANKATSELSGASKEFNQAQDAAGVDPNVYSTEKIYNLTQDVLKNPNQVYDNSKNAFNTEGTQSDIDALNNVRSKASNLAAGTDTAAKSLTDLGSYQTAKGDLTTAQQSANMLGNESGRQTLLQQAYHRPDYSAGENKLDQLLTQTVPSNKERFNTLQGNLLGQYGLGNQDTQAIQAATDKRADVIKNTQQAQKNISNVLTGAVDANNPQQGVLTQYQNNLLTRPDQLNTQQQQTYNNAINNLAASITKQYGTSTPFGVNATDLAKSVITPQSALGGANINNTLSSADLSKLNALNSLAGYDKNTLGSTVVNPGTEGQFSGGVNADYGAGNQQIQQKANAVIADASALANKGIQNTANTVPGILNSYKSDYLNDVQNSGQQANKAVSDLSSQVQSINDSRANSGLPPLQGTPTEWNNATQQTMNQLAYGATVGRSQNAAAYDPATDYTQKITYKGNTAANYLSDRINSGDKSYANAYNSLIATMNSANFYNTLLQDVKSNPSLQVPTGPIESVNLS